MGLAVLVISGSAFVASVLDMSARLEQLREMDPVRLHYFIPLTAADFMYLGRPVRIDTTTEASGRGVVHLRYGESRARLPVLGRDLPDLGPIERHQDWMRVLLLAGDRGEDADPVDLLARGGLGSRLIVVARGPAPGLDAETWGEAHYKDWVYTIITFGESGDLQEEHLTYRDLAAEQHSWQFAAAMNVTPSLHTPAQRSSSPISYPNFKPVRSAFSSMGWTWPAAGVTALGVLVSLLVLGATFVSRDRPAPTG